MISSLSPIPSLPKPIGPHKVGTTEWEIPVSELPSSSLSPDPKITTIKFRLFYPTMPTATSKVAVPWLPSPQRQWNEAYASFLGASPKLSSIISILPFLINFTNIPAVADSPLLPRSKSTKYPVVVFSHGLGGNYNTYSAVCASLASFGIVCVAPEHRDGSAPVTLIRSADGVETSIRYQRHPHTPTTKVFNSRNAQLRIRLWELEQLYAVLSRLNAGQTFSNYAVARRRPARPPLVRDTLDLQPGRVTWVGHSFGGATIVQFIKSVYYHQFLPSLQGTQYENDPDWRPLSSPVLSSELVRQITPDSPVGLLDLWAMPLRAELTKWLWEKPLPCYDRKPAPGTNNDHTTPNVVAIMTAEFYKHTELLIRMKAALSANPPEAIATLERQRDKSNQGWNAAETTALSTPPNKASSETEVHGCAAEDTSDSDAEGFSLGSAISASTSPSSAPSRSTSPSPSRGRNKTLSPSSSTTSIVPSFSLSPTSLPTPPGPKLFLIPRSAHLSQSDFGLLFPKLTRYLMKAEQPKETIQLNVRAVLSVMRGAGLEIENYQNGLEEEQEDPILTDRCNEERFVPLKLVE
ncbi:uncharacterized protein Z518_01941 [Rhinocladiella mackenziei CBS 650.93]|uniref:Putative phospholipase n=1 Tax=Rhinocladiella mackenziei CBS 650.93 TaxID=1442369 RepID=A0A0D2H9X0_9EURO|nr:uncharacterized protein Z518_01941 [Rhinocladiella mackenziei CBS 650.93]KIX07288.1 hypothetical protein Z518_01941 [Rhinocladiella mackenziei CBS 650.93]